MKKVIIFLTSLSIITGCSVNIPTPQVTIDSHNSNNYTSTVDNHSYKEEKNTTIVEKKIIKEEPNKEINKKSNFDGSWSGYVYNNNLVVSKATLEIKSFGNQVSGKWLFLDGITYREFTVSGKITNNSVSLQDIYGVTASGEENNNNLTLQWSYSGVNYFGQVFSGILTAKLTKN